MFTFENYHSRAIKIEEVQMKRPVQNTRRRKEERFLPIHSVYIHFCIADNETFKGNKAQQNPY